MCIIDYGLPTHRYRGSSGHRVLDYSLAFAGTFAAYLAAAQVGWEVLFSAGNAARLWPAAAVSLAAILLFGMRMSPAIFAAAMAVGLAHRTALIPSLGIALANTAQPMVGAMLLSRVADFRSSLQRLRDVVALAMLGAVAAPAVGAGIWVLFRYLALNRLALQPFHAWFIWLRSDAVSILMLVPLLLVWSRPLPVKFRARQLPEAAIALASLVAVDWLVFGIRPTSTAHNYAVEYIAFPVVIWIALRFGPRGATLGVFVTGSIAIWQTLQGNGPFIREPFGDRTLALHVFLAVLAITGLIIAANVAEHRRTEATLLSSEEHLRVSEERYRDLFENAQDFIVTLDLEGRFTSANKAVLQVSGYSHAELLNKKIFEVVAPGSAELAWSAFKEVVNGQRLGGQSQLELVCKDGRTLWIEVASRRLTQREATIGIQSIGRDISWRKRLEQELLHSQKLEAVGRLAGGVAHDFNNLLGVIIGYSDLILEERRPENLLRQRVEEIRKAGKRAAEVTQQLLAFSRKQVLAPKVVDLSAIVSETSRMLLRLLGEDVELIAKLSPAETRVQTDPAHMEQVIMNLAINARDAMPRGGKLILETASITVDAAQGFALFEELIQHGLPIVPGRYVVLAVADTGVGMDEQTKARIFDPFFTTKPQGEGTGLGLATVYGFVKQSGGYIRVESTVNRGTRFSIYLPQVPSPADDHYQERPQAVLPRGMETVLLVEDEESLRELNRELMEGLGYTVLQAAYGAEALEMATAHTGPIELLLTDVVMPGMSGRELAERLSLIRPETKVLYMSGYTDNVMIHHGVLNTGIAFLQKPFTRDALARKLREVLGATRR